MRQVARPHELALLCSLLWLSVGQGSNNKNSKIEHKNKHRAYCALDKIDRHWEDIFALNK